MAASGKDFVVAHGNAGAGFCGVCAVRITTGSQTGRSPDGCAAGLATGGQAAGVLPRRVGTLDRPHGEGLLINRICRADA